MRDETTANRYTSKALHSRGHRLDGGRAEPQHFPCRIVAAKLRVVSNWKAKREAGVSEGYAVFSWQYVSCRAHGLHV
jgi:hypothetical protein